MNERLEEIKRHYRTGHVTSDDILWLISEVEKCHADELLYKAKYERLKFAVNQSTITGMVNTGLIRKALDKE